MLSAIVGVEELTPFTITGNVGEKPESKIWTHADRWWGVFSDSAGTHLWRLDGQTWTKTLKLSALKGARVDAKAQGDVTHVLFENNLSSQLYSLQFVPGSVPNYGLWSQRSTPATVKLASSVEAATIDIDSTGRMWVAYDDDRKNIEVRYSDSPYSVWSDPIVLANNVDQDDLVALTALPNGTIGALWSNQTTRLFHFRTHVDGTDPTVWTADELPASRSALKIDNGFADGHINLAVGSDSTLYAAIKTGYRPKGTPEMGLLVRRPNGAWTFHDWGIPDGTRPIVQLNEIANTLIFSYDDDYHWVYYECNATTIQCTGPRVLVNDGDNGTSTKQTVTSELVVLTSGKTTSGKVWGTRVKFNVVNSAPTVDAGPDQSIYDTQHASLSGIVRDDGLPGPSRLTTRWEQISGPGTADFANAAARQTSVSFSRPGVYVLQLSAHDTALGATDRITIQVLPTPPNQPPQVNAGTDLTMGVAQTVALDGTVVDDGLPFSPGVVTTRWSLVSGPGTATFGDDRAVDTTLAVSSIGTYTLRLTASDGDRTSSDEMVVTVNLLPPNQKPLVEAGPDQTVLPGIPVKLNGTVTDDHQPVPPDALRVQWSQVSGPGAVVFADATSRATTATFSELGTYVLRLSADDTELSGEDTVTMTVVNEPTTISFQDGVLPTTAYKGTRDTKLRASNNRSNYGRDRRLEVDGNPDYASLLRWDLTAIPPGATVMGASLTLNVENISKSTFPIYELVRDWMEMEATYLQAAKSVPWATPGAAGIDADRGNVPLGVVQATKRGLLTIDLNAAGVAAVQKWVNDPATNYGFIIQEYANTASDDVDVSSREASKAALRPKLTVQYVGTSSPRIAALRSPLQNGHNPLDVNGDSQVTPFDALSIFNALNLSGLPGGGEGEDDLAERTLFLDVSGDGAVTPRDALLVINHLNDGGLGAGEAPSLPLVLSVPSPGISSPLLASSLRASSQQESPNGSKGQETLPGEEALLQEFPPESSPAERRVDHVLTAECGAESKSLASDLLASSLLRDLLG